jgi:hypothetical protein
MVGFPHSEIIGSKLIRSSPTLIAAYYVLHRLCTPRHPLDALKTLDRSHYQCPQCQRHQPLLKANVSIVGIVNCHRIAAATLIGQIKLTRIHAAYLFLPGVRVKRNRRPSLYNVERSANQAFAGLRSANFVSLLSHTYVPFGDRHSRRPPGQNSIPNKVWWSLTGSNRRHPACKAGALPAELRPHLLNRP